MRDWLRTAFFLAAGLAFGLVLETLGGLLTGAGHGTYLFLALACAPFGYIGLPHFVFWGVVGILLAKVRYRAVRYLLTLLMLVHYLTVPVLGWRHDFSITEHFARSLRSVPITVILATLIYLGAQVLVWVMLFRATDWRWPTLRRNRKLTSKDR